MALNLYFVPFIVNRFDITFKSHISIALKYNKLNTDDSYFFHYRKMLFLLIVKFFHIYSTQTNMARILGSH